MKKTATTAGSGQQAESDPIVTAASQAVLNLESHSGWTGVLAEAADQSQDKASEPSVSVAAGSDEKAQEPLTLSHTQMRGCSEKDAWQRLVLLGAIPADSFYSPTKAKDGYYRKALKRALSRSGDADGTSKATCTKGSEALTYSELMAAILAATVEGDDDRVMALRAEVISRFRRTDAQVEAALFKLHAQQQTSAGQKQAPESLDLSRISGMDWLVEGFVPDNDLTLLWGDAGTGKTTAALAIALAVLKGTGLLDHEAPAGTGGVLFIASDSGAAPLYASMQDASMADLSEVMEGPQKQFHAWAADADQGMSAWAANLRGCVRLLEFIRRHRIRLVVIDSCKTACSGADLDYTNNQLVSALLTYFKEVICPHAAVVWLNHDGVAKGAHAGAKAWKEVPSMVHRIIREENKDGSFVNSRRIWRVTKTRMGPTREFYYELSQGELRLCPNQDKVGNCLDRVVEVLTGAWQMQGQASLSKADLVERICMTGGPSRKTLDNTLSAATRAKHPQVCRVATKRGHYKLAPRLLDSLKGHTFNGKEQGQNPVGDIDPASSRQVPVGSSRSPQKFPREEAGKTEKVSCSNGAGRVPSRSLSTSNGAPLLNFLNIELVELPAPVGSGADAFDDDDDPAWG